MRDDKPPNLRGALRQTNGVAFLFSTTTALFLLLPVYLQQAGSSAAQIGLVAGLMRVSMLMARPVAGRLLDRFGRRPVIIGGGIVTIVAIPPYSSSPRLASRFCSFAWCRGRPQR
jgi:MFS family permease